MARWRRLSEDLSLNFSSQSRLDMAVHTGKPHQEVTKDGPRGLLLHQPSQLLSSGFSETVSENKVQGDRGKHPTLTSGPHNHSTNTPHTYTQRCKERFKEASDWLKSTQLKKKKSLKGGKIYLTCFAQNLQVFTLEWYKIKTCSLNIHQYLQYNMLDRAL